GGSRRVEAGEPGQTNADAEMEFVKEIRTSDHHRRPGHLDTGRARGPGEKTLRRSAGTGRDRSGQTECGYEHGYRGGAVACEGGTKQQGGHDDGGSAEDECVSGTGYRNFFG